MTDEPLTDQMLTTLRLLDAGGPISGSTPSIRSTLRALEARGLVQIDPEDNLKFSITDAGRQAIAS